MTDYHIYTIDENNFELALSFSWAHCTDLSQRSYLLYTSQKEMAAEYRREMEDEDGQLLGCFKKAQLVGVMCLEVLPADNYVETMGLYYDPQQPEVIEAFLDFINQRYSRSTMYIGLPYENEMLKTGLLKAGYQLTDDSNDWRFDLAGANNNFKIPETVKSPTAEEMPIYLTEHDRLFPDIYWQADHLAEQLADFWIFYTGTLPQISGAAFIKRGKRIAEIFGLMAQNNQIAADLLQAGLAVTTATEPPLDSLVFFMDTKAVIDNQAAQKAGFKLFSHYQCYVKTIV